MNTKTCTKCGKTKPLSEFGKHSNSNDGHAWRCKACSREQGRKFSKTPSGVYTAIKGRNKFWREKPLTITKEEFIEWYINEPKICAYCDLPESKLPVLKDSYNKKIHRLSIDCKDNPRGYVIGNIVLSCLRCNYLKSDLLSYNEMREIGQKYIKPRWEKQLGPL